MNPKSGSVLIIGGTRFQGRFLIPFLMDKGFEVTVFHRGQTPLALEGVSEILGDRNVQADLDRLASAIDETLDSIIDTCAYFPSQVRTLLSSIGSKSTNYVFVSSIAVYRDPFAVNDENALLHMPVSGEADQLSPENYGALKVACESVAQELFPSRHLIARPSILIGPGDHTHRLYFWHKIVKTLGCRLTLEGGDKEVMLLDVRDYAEFLSQSITKGIYGIFNISPKGRTLNDLLGILALQLNIPEDRQLQLTRDKLESIGMDIPFYLPEGSEQFLADRAIDAGLSTRPLELSVEEIQRENNLKDANPFRLQAVLEKMLSLTCPV